jgi:hypothetical protein
MGGDNAVSQRPPGLQSLSPAHLNGSELLAVRM